MAKEAAFLALHQSTGRDPFEQKFRQMEQNIPGNSDITENGQLRR